MSEGKGECGMRTAVSESSTALPLAPGFSRVSATRSRGNRFNGFPRPAKPLKRFGLFSPHDTRLKPGANERGSGGRRAFASGGQFP